MTGGTIGKAGGNIASLAQLLKAHYCSSSGLSVLVQHKTDMNQQGGLHLKPLAATLLPEAASCVVT